MKRTSLAVATAALFGLGASTGALAQSTAPAQAPAQAQPPATSPAPAETALKGPVVSQEVISISGKVTAIDPAKRTVAVTGDQGNTATMYVGPNVHNFDNVKLGDQVTMRYTQAHSLAIARGGVAGTESEMGEIRTKVEADASRQADVGGKPGMSAMERSTLVANVFQIDRERGILTLRGTDGVPVDIKVADKDALEQINLNDQLVIGYRQAATVSIEPGASNEAAGTAAPPPNR